MKITLFVDKRHVKDILRSMSHELVHHTQNCRGEFDGGINTAPGYAQEDGKMRKMEEEAYLEGQMLLRDWEDAKKLKEKKVMAELEEKTVPEPAAGPGKVNPGQKQDEGKDVEESINEGPTGGGPHVDPETGEEVSCEDVHPGVEHEAWDGQSIRRTRVQSRRCRNVHRKLDKRKKRSASFRETKETVGKIGSKSWVEPADICGILLTVLM